MATTFDGKKEKEEILFVGMNIKNELEKLLNKTKKQITDGMNENELKAYDLAINNTISLIEVLTNENGADFIICNIDNDIPTEYTFSELKSL